MGVLKAQCTSLAYLASSHEIPPYPPPVETRCGGAGRTGSAGSTGHRRGNKSIDPVVLLVPNLCV